MLILKWVMFWMDQGITKLITLQNYKIFTIYTLKMAIICGDCAERLNRNK